MISYASIAPHPPILLPTVGSQGDREKVKRTLAALDFLAGKFQEAKPDVVIISAPHPDWGFDVPLYFLAGDFKGEIKTILTGFESPQDHFEKGKKFFQNLEKDKNYAFIASGDLSHCLKEDGPYGFHPDGPKFDKALQEYLREKNVPKILALNKEFPEAAECGLRSFAFLLGVLEASGMDWHVDILSYEGPFGVGYLVAQLL